MASTQTHALNRNSQSTNWCFTVNNYTDANVNHLNQVECKYLVYGYEVAPTTGTLHLQCFIQFSSRKRFSTVLNLIPFANNLDKAYSTAWHCMEYCKKDGIFNERGEPPLPQGVAGGRATAELWTNIWEAAKEGDLEGIPPEYRIRFYGTIRRIAKDFMAKPAPLDQTCGLWIYGATGTGKTHTVVTAYPERYIKPLNKWWDGYQGEEVVHIDEIAPGHTSWISPYLKKWADKWPFDAEVKGGAMQIRPRKVIVTSNYSIDEMEFNDNDKEAIRRRFTEIRKVRDQNLIV